VVFWAPVTTYELVLVAHLLGALLFFGGALVAGVAFEVAARRERPSEIALLLGLARVGAVFVSFGAVLVLGAGLWLASDASSALVVVILVLMVWQPGR